MRYMQTTGQKRHAAPARALLLVLLTVDVSFAAPGDLDPTFDGDGVVITDFIGEEAALAVALQADGKIVAAGQAGDPTGVFATGFALARYLSNGQLDASFDGDGRVITDFGFPVDIAQAVAVQPDGRIIAAGYVDTPSEGFAEAAGRPAKPRTGFALARYLANGSLDTTFGRGGKVITDRRNTSLIYAVALQPDGKIVVAGQAFDRLTSRSDFALARYRSNGMLDPTFGDRGIVITDFGGQNDHARAIALQPDGRILAAGQGDLAPGQVGIAVARYRPNGRLDTSFGGDGLVTTFIGDGYFATGLALQSDGKIVASAHVQGFDADLALLRYAADGTLDPTFDGDGQAIVDLGGSDHITGIALQPSGKIVAAGWFIDPLTFLNQFAVARFLASGILDTTFSGDGYATTALGSGDLARAAAVALQPDGKIVAAGVARSSEGASDFALARYQGAE